MLVIIRLHNWRPRHNLYRSISTGAPRVRFAPSPTGYLHLGGLRTALYNYLFAKSRGGTFILRIEDTDQNRKVEGAVEALKRDLEWAGIEIGEGPAAGGDYKPYVQSERLNIYQEHITKLLYNGSAYKCFCSERRLNVLRRAAARAQQVPRYDNRCRDLTPRDLMDKMKAGAPYCIRFKLTPSIQSFEDLIFGRIAYDVSLNEGDPVLMKTDGYPTYHFANVVDDHLMRITHVLRGVEWQISTTKHLLLYKAFGWSPPEFGHLPLIVNADGTKLSKRQSDVTVADYRDKGVFPLSLVNFITLAGGGFPHEPGAGVAVRSLAELAAQFDLKKISCHPSRLDPALLRECNRVELRRRLRDPALCGELEARVRRLAADRFPRADVPAARVRVRSALRWAADRLATVDDLASDEFAFLWAPPASVGDVDEDMLRALRARLERLDRFEGSETSECLRGFAAEYGVRVPALMATLRAVLGGRREGPPVADMMALLGKTRTLARIEAALA